MWVAIRSVFNKINNYKLQINNCYVLIPYKYTTYILYEAMKVKC